MLWLNSFYGCQIEGSLEGARTTANIWLGDFDKNPRSTTVAAVDFWVPPVNLTAGIPRYRPIHGTKWSSISTTDFISFSTSLRPRDCDTPPQRGAAMPHALTVSVFRRNPDDTVPRSGSRAFDVSGLCQSPTSPSEPLEQDRDPLRECCQSPLRIIDVIWRPASGSCSAALRSDITRCATPLSPSTDDPVIVTGT
jgi:hypothetical protein